MVSDPFAPIPSVMACPGGCLGGGGEPKSDDPDILKKRAKGIYDIDAGSTIRKSHENAEVQQLYKISWVIHCRKPRNDFCTRRMRLVDRRGICWRRFLDAVDHRDGAKAASLFADNGDVEHKHSQLWSSGGSRRHCIHHYGQVAANRKR